MIAIARGILSLEDIEEILVHGQFVTLDEGAMQKVNENFLFLKKFSADKLIYGINTGFGPMAQYKIAPENSIQLQLNLIKGKIIAYDFMELCLYFRI